MPLPRAVLNAPNESPLPPKVEQSADMQAIDEQQIAERAWKALKEYVAVRDKGRCRLCGKRCSYGARTITERGDPRTARRS